MTADGAAMYDGGAVAGPPNKDETKQAKPNPKPKKGRRSAKQRREDDDEWTG